MNNDTGSNSPYEDQLVGSQRDTTIQIVLSAVLGISAFFAFCVCSSQELVRAKADSRSSSFGPSGPHSMQRANDNGKAKQVCFLTCLIHGSDGYR